MPDEEDGLQLLHLDKGRFAIETFQVKRGLVRKEIRGLALGDGVVFELYHDPVRNHAGLRMEQRVGHRFTRGSFNSIFIINP